MKSTKFINSISPELKAKIPKLKPGQVVTFQMLNGQPNPDPDDKERAKEPVLYGKKQLRTNFRVWDEWLEPKKNEDGSISYAGGMVDVGAVQDWDGEKPVRFKMFVPGMGEHSRFPGKFSLTGGRIGEEELYEILYLSPEREGTPCPDASIEKLFKILDLKADSKETVTRFDILSKAIDIAKKLKVDSNEKDAKNIMAALNQPIYQDADVLFAKVKELATTKPEIFIQVAENKETPIIGMVREALSKSVIDHDIVSGKVTMGGVVLTTMKVQTSEEFIPNFVKWLGSATNGGDVLNNIKKQLEKREVAAS